MRHKIGAGEVAFDWRGKSTNQDEDSGHMEDEEKQDCDRSLFIEPVKWMADSIQVPEGKVNSIQ